MRFEQLVIEKYGLYAVRRLDLTGMPGLVVLYGANEAGKSTTRSAVIDLLYGIPSRSAHAHIFGGPVMALSATLRMANGAELAIKRTKGNARTLSDGEGVALDEFVLASSLGANDRERFLALFALNHETLRTGGEHLLDAKGDIGRLIVEAGGGLGSLAAQMEALGSRADQLYSQRKSASRQFYIELDRYQSAEREVRDGLLTVEAYEKTHKAVVASGKRLAELRAQLLEVRQTHRSLDRMARVCPLLHQLTRQLESFSQFSDLPEVDAGFAQQVRNALVKQAAARAALEDAEARLGELNANIDAICIPQQLLDSEAVIADIVIAGVHVSKELIDRIGRVTELAQSQAMLDGLRRLTGLEPGTDIRNLMPSAIDLDRTRALAIAATRLITEIKALDKQLREIAGQIAHLSAQQHARETEGSHVPLGFDAAGFASLDSKMRDAEGRRTQLQRMSDEVQRRSKSMGFETVEALESLRLPDESIIQSEIECRNEFARKLQLLQELVTEQSQKKSRCSADISTLRRDGEVPTEAAITEARAQRTAAWTPIRAAYIDPDKAALTKTPAETRLSQISRFEEQASQADSLVDRKSQDAERIADLKLAEQELTDAEFATVTAKREIDELERAGSKEAEAWARTWPDGVKLSSEPAALKSAASERSEILALNAQFRDASPDADRLYQIAQSGIEALTLAEKQFGIFDSAGAGLTARIHAVTARIKTHEANHADYRAAEKSLLESEVRRARAEQALADLRGEQEEWRTEWTAVMQRLRLSADASPETATDIAAKWDAAAGVLTTIALTQQRLDNMDRDERRLREKIELTSRSLSLVLPSDVVAASEMLQRRLDEAKKIQTERSGLMQQALALASARERAAKEVTAGEESIAELCSTAGCAERDLSEMAERFDRRSACAAEIRQTEQSMLAAGDQISIEELKGQLAGREQDKISALMQEESEREALVQTAADNELKEEERLRQELQKYSSGDDINRPVAERESAAAALRQVVSDYLELALAKELIEEAMAAVREEQQDPLLLRAGTLFSNVTNGAFIGIRADIDERGNPSVVGVRAESGERVALDVMSDGTRDQLFLAFRVAAVEQYCASAEPLPFIADDLLVHFDDGRSQSALELLAELGKTTQVLLFTHHVQVKNGAVKLGVNTIDLDRC